jgi:hypothetical protein
MISFRLMRMLVATFGLYAVLGVSAAGAQGTWTPIGGETPAPVPGLGTGTGPGKANQAAPGSRDYYAFHRQWIEAGATEQEKKYWRVIEYLKSVDIDPFAWSGKLLQKPRMTYGEPHRWLGNNDSCDAGGIEQPTVPIVFGNGYYGIPDGESIYIFGLLGGNVTFGPLGQPYCDGDFCPPITIDGHTWFLQANSKTFRDCARYAETSLAHIGTAVKLLRPRDAVRDNPKTAFVSSSMFNGNSKASWKTFAEMVVDMMQQ